MAVSAVPCPPLTIPFTIHVSGGLSLGAQLHELEARVLRETLSACGGSVLAAARSLSKPRSWVYDALSRHGIDHHSYK